MGAGCPGDNPLTDIFVHGLEPYPLDMCILIELIGNKIHDYLLSKKINYFEWEFGNNLDFARHELVSLYLSSTSKPSSNGKNTEQLLKIARCFYTEGIKNKSLKAIYWELSKQYFALANNLSPLKNKDLIIYEKLHS